MKLPDLNLLVALDILLEEGSAVAAARRMNLSAPAMSRTLARIRDAIGDPVFVRSGRGLAPTPRALELREQVRGVVEQAHAIFTSGREVDLRTLERTFSLCANDVFVGAYGGKLRDLLAVHAPHTVLRFVPEGDGAGATVGITEYLHDAVTWHGETDSPCLVAFAPENLVTLARLVLAAFPAARVAIWARWEQQAEAAHAAARAVPGVRALADLDALGVVTWSRGEERAAAAQAAGVQP